MNALQRRKRFKDKIKNVPSPSVRMCLEVLFEECEAVQVQMAADKAALEAELEELRSLHDGVAKKAG